MSTDAPALRSPEAGSRVVRLTEALKEMAEAFVTGRKAANAYRIRSAEGIDAGREAAARVLLGRKAA